MNWAQPMDRGFEARTKLQLNQGQYLPERLWLACLNVG
jgi:hypothetical protein